MKIYEPLTSKDKRWIRTTFSPHEIEVCELIWGGIPIHDEGFVRNSELFKNQLNEKPKRN